ncbi:hypothetical protein RND81_08G021600 [Saponaria officinalis]|uniref:Secreted protein n=1 Tax=Saponaria officinalis TaxID=3572 RepID=A0AAW1J3B0_SAPOF
MRLLAQKQVIGLALASFCYRLWWNRNTARVESCIATPRMLCNGVRDDVITRSSVCNVLDVCPRLRYWLEELRGRVCVASRWLGDFLMWSWLKVVMLGYVFF